MEPGARKNEIYMYTRTQAHVGGDMSKENRSQPDRTLFDQNWNNLSKKINDMVLD